MALPREAAPVISWQNGLFDFTRQFTGSCAGNGARNQSAVYVRALRLSAAGKVDGLA
jgi:hypothetical protein